MGGGQSVRLLTPEFPGMTYFFHVRITFKSQFVVVIDVGKLTLCHVDSALGDIIHLALLEELIESINLVIEPGSTDFPSFIEKVDCEEFAFTLLIMPRFDFRFRGDSGFDSPFILIGRERFDWINAVVGASSRTGTTQQVRSLLSKYQP